MEVVHVKGVSSEQFSFEKRFASFGLAASAHPEDDWIAWDRRLQVNANLVGKQVSTDTEFHVRLFFTRQAMQQLAEQNDAGALDLTLDKASGRLRYQQAAPVVQSFSPQSIAEDFAKLGIIFKIDSERIMRGMSVTMSLQSLDALYDFLRADQGRSGPIECMAVVSDV